MSATGRCPSELAWAKHLAGAGWLASLRLRAHAVTCARCRSELAAVRADRAAFEAAPRRSQDLRRLGLEAPALRGQAARSPRLAVAAAIAACAALAVVVLVGRPSLPALSPKGGDLFEVYVDSPSGARPLGPTCAPGDRLMGRYRTEHAYLLVLERDGSGAVQVLFPAGGARSARLEAAEGTTPQSWVLDQVGGRECFAAFFSDAPLEASRADAALRGASGPPELPGDVTKLRCCDKGDRR